MGVGVGVEGEVMMANFDPLSPPVGEPCFPFGTMARV